MQILKVFSEQAISPQPPNSLSPNPQTNYRDRVYASNLHTAVILNIPHELLHVHIPEPSLQALQHRFEHFFVIHGTKIQCNIKFQDNTY
jgi:hypothetical protein